MKPALFIDGHWVDGDGAPMPVHDPSLGQIMAQVPAASAHQVNLAVQAARRALPGWRSLSGARRAEYLQGFARHLQQRREGLIALQMRNNGKPRHEAELDLDDAIATFDYYAGLAAQLDARQDQPVPLQAAGFSAHCRFEALGVVGMIVPWNFPLVTSAWKLAPALAAGCTLVLKPSEVTPLIEQVYGEIADALGLPAGVLNLVAGAGETGAALSQHPGLDKLSFTGSTATGQRVMASSAAFCRPLTLELGGKSPILVFADADLDQAVHLSLIHI